MATRSGRAPALGHAAELVRARAAPARRTGRQAGLKDACHVPDSCFSTRTSAAQRLSECQGSGPWTALSTLRGDSSTGMDTVTSHSRRTPADGPLLPLVQLKASQCNVETAVPKPMKAPARSEDVISALKHALTSSRPTPQRAKYSQLPQMPAGRVKMRSVRQEELQPGRSPIHFGGERSQDVGFQSKVFKCCSTGRICCANPQQPPRWRDLCPCLLTVALHITDPFVQGWVRETEVSSLSPQRNLPPWQQLGA